MRYFDSGSRDAAQTVGAWFQSEMTPDIDEFRCQSGFFGSGAISLLIPTLDRLRADDKTVHFVIGSNEPGTLGDDVRWLVDYVGVSRTNGKLGIVCFDSGFYHPKTYHIRRSDGTQAAFVGSTNLGLPGVSGRHIEAGLVVDTRDGDPANVLDEIAAAVDAWFNAARPRDGFDLVGSMADVDRLIAERVLLAAPLPRRPRARRSGGVGTGAAPRPRLTPLLPIPRLPARPTTTAPAPAPAPMPAAPPPAAPVPALVPTVLPQFAGLVQYYPAPLIVDWSIVGPTRDAVISDNYFSRPAIIRIPGL